jgi:hypothetical protein
MPSTNRSLTFASQIAWGDFQEETWHIDKYHLFRPYNVKKVIGFPVPSRDITNQTLPGQELLNFSRTSRVWLVTSRLWRGKSITFF